MGGCPHGEEFCGSYWWQMNEVCQSTSGFIQTFSKFGMEFQYKIRGFDLKNNFEIEPSLGMGLTMNNK